MTDRKVDKVWSDHYWHAFRMNTHQLIAWGYSDAQAQLGRLREEQEITQAIVEAIQARLRDVACPKWCKWYAVKEDNPVPTPGRTGKRRKRPDVIIEWTAGVGRPEYIFEAKPLKAGTYPEGNYLGTHGLQRLLRGEYASRYPEAGMLGYVQSHTIEHWTHKIQDAIQVDASTKRSLALRVRQCASKVNPMFPTEWESEHDRKTGRPIRILHVLLDCCPIYVPAADAGSK